MTEPNNYFIPKNCQSVDCDKRNCLIPQQKPVDCLFSVPKEDVFDDIMERTMTG